VKTPGTGFGGEHAERGTGAFATVVPAIYQALQERNRLSAISRRMKHAGWSRREGRQAGTPWWWLWVFKAKDTVVYVWTCPSHDVPEGTFHGWDQHRADGGSVRIVQGDWRLSKAGLNCAGLLLGACTSDFISVAKSFPN